MCQIAAVSGITDKNRSAVWEFMTRLGVYMSRGNRDGLGYAALDHRGKIFGEIWLNNFHAFNPSMMPLKREYKSFGNNIARDSVQSIILHTRMATSGGGIENNHPFFDDPTGSPNTALIHNGVISNHNKFTKKFSTCDSEVILHEYLGHSVNKDPKRIVEIFNSLTGWMACAVLTKDNMGTPVLDVFSDGTRLSSVYINDLGVRIFCTSDVNLYSVCEDMKLPYSSVFKVPTYGFYRYNAITGALIEKGRVTPEKESYSVEDGWGNRHSNGDGSYNWSAMFDALSQERDAWEKDNEIEVVDYWKKLFGDGE